MLERLRGLLTCTGRQPSASASASAPSVDAAAGTRRRQPARLWAEVFHVSSTGSGTVKWQQISDDLVPVSLTCIQDSPNYVFHITAYNSQVDKILDVRLTQPGTRIGQASECFVYWKDQVTGDTWGLNFTSPMDARQFREVCSPVLKFSRKASSSYSLKLDGKKHKGNKRKPLSTPSSPSGSREPQCTCMTAEQYARLRAQDPRFRVSDVGPPCPRCTISAPGGNTTNIVDFLARTSNGDGPCNGSGVTNGPQMNGAPPAAHAGTGGIGNGAPPPLYHPASPYDNLAWSSTLPRMQGVSSGRSTPAGGPPAAGGCEPHRPANMSAQYKTMRGRCHPALLERPASAQPGQQSSTASCSTTFDSNSELDQNVETEPNSPTYTRLLLEYERHLRNTLAKGDDAESYSLHTFEALLSQSNEDLEASGGSGAASAPARGESSGAACAEQEPAAADSRPEPPPPALSSTAGDALPMTAAIVSETERAGDSLETTTRRQCMVACGASSCSSDAALTAAAQPPGGSCSRRPTASAGAAAQRSNTLPTRPGPAGGVAVLPVARRDQRPPSSTAAAAQTAGGPQATVQAAAGMQADRRAEPPASRHSTLRRHASLSRQDSVRSGYVSDKERGYLSDHQQAQGRPPSGHQHGCQRGVEPPPTAHQRVAHQTSFESADSKLCYLTSSEMSDDDRMSLTTAVSDEEEGDASLHASPYRANRSGSSAASFNCTGAVRKAGFLSVKKWLLRKKHQVELARKRGWKGYWVCLKGTTLLFYPCESREGRSIEQAPKHLIIVDGAIMQSIPEHPKREYIFCLSTAFGDAYLFQAPCQVELENWINSIHSACAAAFARHRGKTGTLHLLQEDIFRLERSIESDSKLKHMADLQLSVVSEQDSKQEISSQLSGYDDSLERLHCEQFRLRCYMASLQGGELPNPKGLLTHVSRSTKLTLNRLGVFNVSSFHAYICARSPSLLNNLLAGRGATKRRAPMLSRSVSGSVNRSFNADGTEEPARTCRVRVPDNQYVTITLRENMTVEEFLIAASLKKNLNPMEQFVRVKKRRDMENTNYFVPHHSDFIDNFLQTHEVCEVCTKVLFQVELSRSALDQMWGFSVEAELIENVDRQDELCCYISRVEDRSRAAVNGLIRGDEIMVINGAIVSDLDMMYLESVLQEELALCLMMRSSRTEVPDLVSQMKTTDDIIERLVCPPPPSDSAVRDDDIDNMIVPSVKTWGRDSKADIEGCPPPPSDTSDRSNVSSVEIENLLKSANLVTGYCRSPVDQPRGMVDRGPSPTSSIASSQSQAMTPSRHLSDAEKLRKVLTELIDTERTYVKHLNSLIDNYLEPLRRESFITPAEIGALFGNIPDIVEFQRDFLQSLQEAVEMEPNLARLESPTQFKNVLFSIGNAFLYHTSSFKLYSSFCASHSRAQKVLHPSEGNQQLQQFLQRQNPRQQHSSTLESYLIKPIQRILKYPLLLQQLKCLADPQSGEYHHLEEALKGMEKVAEHINEMQRIHEEYGAIFDHLFRQHQKSTKMVLPVASPVDLSPGDLLYYGGVEWLNISDFLGKIKKGLELHAMCFVFKTAVVFLCKERLRQKKKLMSAPGKGNPAEVEIIRYQVLIPVTEVQVRASSCRDVENHYLWELIHLKSQIHRRNEKVYHLSNSTSDFRNAFLKTIRQIIRESVRNMSIPSTKASSTSYKTGTLTSSRTLSMRKKMANKGQRHSAGMSATIDYDNLEGYHENVSGSESNLRGRSHTMDASASAPGGVRDDGSDLRDDTSRSDAEEETLPRRPGQLGRIPNHLSLSTSSTLSAGSTGSQARLIQASNAPEHYQPPHARSAGSPVWKPRGPIVHDPRALPPRSGERIIFDDHPGFAQHPHVIASQSSGARSKADAARLARARIDALLEELSSFT